MTETLLFSVSFVKITLSISPQSSPLSFIPFGTITTPPPRSYNASKIITSSIPSFYITLHIPINRCTTSKTTPSSPKHVDIDSHPSDFDFSTPTSFPLTMPEARAFPEDTPIPPTPPHQPIDVPVFYEFME